MCVAGINDRLLAPDNITQHKLSQLSTTAKQIDAVEYLEENCGSTGVKLSFRNAHSNIVSHECNIPDGTSVGCSRTKLFVLLNFCKLEERCCLDPQRDQPVR